ncbi:hypothetical protein AAH995_16050 [Pseudomonas putida]|uniref:Uncharacterized protein n=1 Tax=Pseudomonas putida TaxID=303 RepID=A0A7Y7ZBP9_PSEPU|nr:MULTISPECIES: hypothetical protein [Pseudomonas]KAF1312833.1 hypothetical protein BLX42_01340 [Pseudomonas sp. SG-MS2]NWC81976.1 hypothetical protein [Pseudomonas putida]
MKQAHDISIRSQIQELAKQHGVTGDKDRFSDLASTVTRLSGDVVALDTIERMLVSLKKQGILTKQQILQLEAGYLREQSCSGSGRNLSA